MNNEPKYMKAFNRLLLLSTLFKVAIYDIIDVV